MAKTKIKIPWDSEEEGGGRIHVKEGDYKAKIIKVGTGRSKEKDTPYVGIVLRIIDGPSKKAKGKEVREDLYLTPKSLKRLRLLCEACGVKVPKKAAMLDLAKLKGKVIGISLEDDEYERGNKTITTSRVAFEGFMSKEDYESGGVDDDEDEEDEEDEDDTDTDTDDDEDEDDDDIDIDDDDL